MEGCGGGNKTFCTDDAGTCEARMADGKARGFSLGMERNPRRVCRQRRKGAESTPAPDTSAHVNIPDKLNPVLRFISGQGELHAGVPTTRVKPG